MNLKFFCLGFFLLSAAIVSGQDNQSTESIVVFDPLFWKDQLKLDASQRQKIKEINIEYYERLYAIHEEPNRQKVQARAAQSLLQRSEEIWRHFTPGNGKNGKSCGSRFMYPRERRRLDFCHPRAAVQHNRCVDNIPDRRLRKVF